MAAPLLALMSFELLCSGVSECLLALFAIFICWKSFGLGQYIFRLSLDDSRQKSHAELESCAFWHLICCCHSPSNTLGLSLTKLHQDHSLIGRESYNVSGLLGCQGLRAKIYWPCHVFKPYTPHTANKPVVHSFRDNTLSKSHLLIISIAFTSW